MGAYDGYKYAKKKKLKGVKKAAAIVGGAALGAINPFKVVKAATKVGKLAKNGVKAAKALKNGKKAGKAAKATKATTKKVVKNTKKLSSSTYSKATNKAVKKASNGGCFIAGTKIHTKDGFKNIEAIKVGDYVWSQDPTTNEKALKSVKKIFVREKDSIIRLSINGEIIETTEEHPFYVEGKGFIAAAELKAGDEVRLFDDEEAYIDRIEEIELTEPIKVYNFEVEDFHTYYVSEQKVLVHNTCAVESSNVKVNSTLALDAPADKNPWKEGSRIYSTVLEDDIIVNMAVSNKGKLGRWATFDDIPNVEFVRNTLAVTPEFKDKINYVQRIKIPKGTRVQIGTAGSQSYNGKLYPGGGTQIEIPKQTILEPIGNPIRIY